MGHTATMAPALPADLREGSAAVGGLRGDPVVSAWAAARCPAQPRIAKPGPRLRARPSARPRRPTVRPVTIGPARACRG